MTGVSLVPQVTYMLSKDQAGYDIWHQHGTDRPFSWVKHQNPDWAFNSSLLDILDQDRKVFWNEKLIYF